MVITDAQGNGLKRRTYNYQIKNGKYKYMIRTSMKQYSKSFINKDDGKQWMDNIYDELLRIRIQFKSKHELDDHINLKIK